MKKFILYLAAAFCFLLISKSASAQFGRPNLGNTASPDTVYVSTTYVTGSNAFAPTNSGGAVQANGWALTAGTIPGLTFLTSTGELVGTPTTVTAGTNLTFTATNGFGTSNPKTVTFVVLAQAPPDISYTTPDIYTGGTGVDLIVTNSNPGITTSYTITSGTLPTGLSFNTATGEITGVPVAVVSPVTYTIDIFANNTTGIASGTTVSITINPPAPIISYINPAPYTVGTAIATLAPTNTGGAVATTGTYGAGVAVASGLSGPYGMTLDASGNVYVANFLGNSITEYSTSGAVATTSLAGLGTVGPVGLVFDAAGNAYVLDQTSGTVVEYPVATGFAAAGTTIINGLSTPTGIAISGSTLYIANSGTNTILEYPTSTTAGTAPTVTITANIGGGFNRRVVSGGIAVDAAGNIWVVDNRFGGFGGAELDEYSGTTGAYIGRTRLGRTNSAISIDASGNFYVTSLGRRSVNAYTSTFGNIATEGGFGSPQGVVTDLLGNLYVSDYNTGTITEYPKASGYVLTGTLPPGLSFNTTTGAITGTPTTPFPATTYTVTAYNGSGGSSTTVTISCVSNPPVISYTPNPAVYGLGAAINLPPTVSGPAILPAGYTTPGTGLTGATTALSATWGMTKDAAGDIWVINGNNTIDEYGPTGTFMKTVTVTGTAGTLQGITINNTTNTIYLSSSTGGVYTILSTAAGTTPATRITNTGVNLQGIVYDPTTGFIYATTSGGNVLRIANTGRFNNARTLIAGLGNATGVTVDASGNIYVLTSTGSLKEYSSAGTFERTVLSGVGTATYGLYIDATGDYFISDAGTGTVKEYNTSGTLVSTTTTGSQPRGIVTDASGDIYVADNAANTVTEYLPSTYYVLSGPALPAGVTFNTANGTFGGSSAVAFGPLIFTVTVYGSGGTGTTTVTITCTNGPIFSYLSPDVYTQGTLITPLTPTVTSGGPISSYAVTGAALPTGLVLNTSTGVISGTPTVLSPATNYSIIGTSATGSTTVLVNIAVILGKPVISYPVPPVYVVGATITPLNPTNTGGAATSYAITGTPLPAGLSIDPLTGIISGTPTTVTASFSYTVTATNAVGSGTCTVTISVVNLPVIAYTGPNVYTMGTAITTLVPSSTGSVPTIWSINTPLPTGLIFNTGNGQISGTPTVVSSTTIYTVTATNANGSGTATVSITVNDVPPIITYASPQTYTVGTTIAPLAPTNTGTGALPTGYIISGLPAGLVIDPLTGIISGTPTAATALAVYTVTATNDGGNGTFGITITVIAQTPVITYTTPNILAQNLAMAPLGPANSGSTPVSYAITAQTGILIPGLSFSTSTGVFSGTPTATQGSTSYTVTATDINGGTGTFTLIISCVVADNWIGAAATPAWSSGGNWSTGSAPGASGVAAIGVSVSFNLFPTVQDALAASKQVGSIIIGTNGGKAGGFTVNSGFTLAVKSDITYQSDLNSGLGYTASISGAGTVAVTGGINVIANTSLATPASYTETMTSSVANMTVNGNIALSSSDDGAGNKFNSIFNVTGGNLTLTGAVQTTNTAAATSTFTVTPVTTATLQLLNIAALSGLSATGTNVVNFDKPGATIEYSAAGNQTYYTNAAITGLTTGPSYNSIEFAGSGIKTPTGTSANSLNIDGNFTNLMANDAADYIDLSLPTVTFDGTTQSIAAGGGTGTKFYNVLFKGTGTTTIATGNAYVASSGVLTMSGGSAVLAAGGLLTLNSDASGSAMVAAIPTGCSITGNVNVQRFITGGTNYRGYRLLSSPVYASASSPISGNNVYSINYGLNSCYLKGTGGTAGGFDATGNPNLYLYRENLAPNNQTFTSGNFRGVNTLYAGTETVIAGAGAVLTNVSYVADVDGAFNIPVGDGYMFFFRGARSAATLAVEQGLSYVPVSATLTAVGTLNQGAITVADWYTPTSKTLGYTTATANSSVRGFNLVGNPYASSIDWDTYSSSVTTAGIYGKNIGPFSYIFDPLSQNYSVYLAGSGGLGATIATANANIIPSGQGFFVISSSNTLSKLVFNEAGKVNSQATTATGNLFLGTPAPSAVIQSLHLKLTRDSVTSRVNTDGIFIIFNKTANPKYDPMEDACYKGGNGTVSLTSVSVDNVSLAINQMPFPTLQTQKIPLIVKANATGLYQISMVSIQSIPTLYTLWLKDAYKQDSLDIRANPVYSFNIDKSDTNSYGANRFSLVMSENPALMVHLLNFNATKATGGSQVVWKTENEQNYTNFTVERSTDGGVTFAVLGGYASSALGTYSFLDANPAMKANQYRLKIQDLNGTISYSKVITLIYGNGDSPLTAHLNVFPNPSADVINVSIPSSTASNSQTNLSGLQTLATTPGLVSTNSGSSSSYDIKIISITGSVIKSATSSSTNWQGSVSGLAPGTYIIQVINNSDKSLVGRNTFVKL